MAIYNKQPVGQPEVAGPSDSQLGSQRKQRGTGFTNLQQYLQASRAGATRATEQLGKTIEKEASKVREGIQSAQMGTSGKIGEEEARLGKAEESIKTAFKDPISAIQNIDPLKQYQTGTLGVDPGSLRSNIQGSISGLSNVQTMGQLAQTPGGRFELLKKQIGYKPSYGLGQQRLDQALIGGAGGLDKLRQIARKEALGTQQLAEQATGSLEGRLKGIQSASEQAKKLYEEEGKKAIERFSTDLESRAKEETDYNKNVIEGLKALASYKYSPQQRESLIEDLKKNDPELINLKEAALPNVIADARNIIIAQNERLSGGLKDPVTGRSLSPSLSEEEIQKRIEQNPSVQSVKAAIAKREEQLQGQYEAGADIPGITSEQRSALERFFTNRPDLLETNIADLTPEQLVQYNIVPQNLQSVGISDVASQQDLAKLKALENLIGKTIRDTVPLDESIVGKYQSRPFDISKLKDVGTEREREMQMALSQAMAENPLIQRAEQLLGVSGSTQRAISGMKPEEFAAGALVPGVTSSSLIGQLLSGPVSSSARLTDPEGWAKILRRAQENELAKFRLKYGEGDRTLKGLLDKSNVITGSKGYK